MDKRRAEKLPSSPRRRGSTDFTPVGAKTPDSRLRGNDEQKPISAISKRVSSGLTPLRSNSKFWQNGTIPWLKTEQLGEKYIYSTTEKISEAALEETSIKVYPPNTITIAMYGEGTTRGNVSIIKSEMATNQACCNVEIDPELADFEYVYYFLKTRYKALRNLSSGVRKNLNSEDIKNFIVRFPQNISEQRKIAAVLSALDAKVDLNNRINAELEALAKAIYDYWFVQFDFPGADGRPYKSSGGAMVWSDTLKREIPEGWSSGSLDDLGQIVGGSTPSTANPDHFGKDMTPWITPKDLSNNKGNKFIARGETDVSEAGIRSASLTLYPAGAVLMSSRAPVGYLAIALNPVTTNQGFKSFVPSKGYGTSFVYYAVQRAIPTIIQYASGSTFVEISGGVLKSVNAVLPDKTIADAFCRRIESVVERQRLAEMENVELIRLRDWLLPLLMNGQVRVASSSDAASAPAPEPVAEPA